MARTLQRAYEHVRAKQRTMAEKNMQRRRGAAFSQTLSFAVGDGTSNKPFEWTMLWEPQQTKTAMDEEGTIYKAPSKWTPKWTGPHKIVGRNINAEGQCHRYIIFHADRARKENMPLNRLHSFKTWSTDRLSTSYDLDGKRGFEYGGFARVDELIIIPLQPPFNYGIARVLTAKASGAMEFQWWGNSAENNLDILKPGWVNSSGKGIYYADEKKLLDHRPHSGGNEVVVRQNQLILHGFQLTPQGRLPANVVRALKEDDRVGGEA
jgi:hypothetical protein